MTGDDAGYWLCWEDPAGDEAWVLRCGTDLVCFDS